MIFVSFILLIPYLADFVTSTGNSSISVLNTAKLKWSNAVAYVRSIFYSVFHVILPPETSTFSK